LRNEVKAMAIQKELFGKCPCGADVYAYTLTNDSCVSARILNMGGIIANLWVKDKNGETTDVVCGYDCVEGYLTSGGYQGALIGRVGNRIAEGKFTLDGVSYQLYTNNGQNHLHGGKSGFNKKIWTVAEAGTDKEPALVLSCLSPDGEESYPGTLTTTVIYTLTAKGGLSIRYLAMTDKATILNLTNHTYFNLSGYQNGDIGTHHLWLDAEAINEVNSALVPTGTILSVDGTPYDFRKGMNVQEGFDADHPMIRAFGGYDNNFIFAKYDGTMKLRATLTHPASGRKMNMYTDQPCVQVYTANMINPADHPFKGGVAQSKHCGMCLETQAMPDSINHPNFTNVVLRPSEVYDHTTIYEFSC